SELARVELEASVAWRRLTKAQQSEIGNILKAFPGTTSLIEYNGSDSEAGLFGSDIAATLHLAAWKISEPLAEVRMREGPLPFGFSPPLETGVTIASTRDSF